MVAVIIIPLEPAGGIAASTGWRNGADLAGVLGRDAVHRMLSAILS
jgi:hypothetical protein